MRDESLRARLEDSARVLADVPVPSMAVLRRRVRRRRTRIGAATLGMGVVAGAAIAVATTGLPGVSATRPAVGSSPSPSPRHGSQLAGLPGWYPAGPPPTADADPSAAPYLVAIDINVDPMAALVEDAFTGKLLATVRVPGGGSFFTVAAADDDRTFFLTTQPSQPSGAVYELRLSASGMPRTLTRVLTRFGASDFAFSPDGTRLAYVTSGGGIEVMSLATGATRTWTVPSGTAQDLSWAGDSVLAFEWASSKGREPLPDLHLLDTTAPGHNLLPSQRVIPLAGHTSLGDFDVIDDPTITLDGSKVFAVAGISSGQAGTETAVLEFSARTGRLLAAVTPWIDMSGMGNYCLTLWMDPSGEHLTAYCNDWYTIDNGRYTRVDLRLPVVPALVGW
jgi:hypothetical protein